MTGGRYALIVANSEYDDPKLKQLRAPTADAEALERVLGDPDIGGFDVSLVMDEPEHLLKRKVNRFLANRGRDDTLLLHFSCHGLKDDRGRLFFAARDTEVEDLHASAMASDWLRERIEDSRSTKIVVLLDCCYSGAFSVGGTRGAGAGTSAHATKLLEGNGRVVLTASDALEFAWEGDTLSGQATPSVFTSALVAGLETGEADRDQDRWISIGELYEYICDWIKREGSPQKPHMDGRVQGELVIARNPFVRPVGLDGELVRLVESPMADVRLLAVPMLASVMARGDGQALTAREVLEQMRDDDSNRVRTAAREVQGGAPAEPAPPSSPASTQRAWTETACLAHDDAVMAVALGADGLLATGSRDHTARLWDVANGRERGRFAHDDWVIAVASSRDGRLLATGCRDLTARVWDVETAAEVARLALDAIPWSVAMNADGGLLAIGCADGTARLWDVAAGCERACLQHDAGVISVAFHPDGTLLATASRQTARAWDLAGRELSQLVAEGAVMAVGFGEERRLLAASAGLDVCQVTGGREPIGLAHERVRAVAFGPEGRLAATAGDDRTARVWELATGRELARLVHPDALKAVAFSGDGRVLATAGRDATARVWAPR